jgi:hypothetical protein
MRWVAQLANRAGRVRVARDGMLRLWHSPTIMSWGSIVARLLSFAVVLPLLLRRLTAPEVAVWYVLTSIQAIQAVADLGFGPTFSRAFAYALGGATGLGIKPVFAKPTRSAAPNWPLLARIRSTARAVYARLCATTLLVRLRCWFLAWLARWRF